MRSPSRSLQTTRASRRVATIVVAVASAVTCAAASVVTSPGTAEAAASAERAASPTLEFANSNSQAIFATAYDSALKNLLKTNTVPFDPTAYNQSGLMDPGLGFVRAGGGYPQPWTRDASVNSWNATSLLDPALAKNTLWSVVDKDADGNLRVKQDDQQWDQVVWVTAAWNHYLVTGDTEFLGNAYQATTNTLRIREQAKTAGFNASYGLFNGASFFNDGISGYPAPPADATESVSIGSMPWPGVATGMFLSTNEVYYAGYRNAANMAERLGRPATEVAGYHRKAAALKAAINRHFWNPTTGRYNYMLLADGTKGDTQEGTGLAFALIFGIADQAQTRSILAHTTEMPWGMPDTYPNFERYSDAQPGRHNAIVWPVVQGLWAKALAGVGATDAFATETALLAKLADNNGGLWEIYHGQTGLVDGGWQRFGDTVKLHWGSEPDQTWSATAYLNMIYSGLFGLTFGDSNLSFAPTLPAGWGDVTLRGLRYRNANLTVKLRGAGNRIQSVAVDGRRTGRRSIPATLAGAHTVEIVLTGAGIGDRDRDNVTDRMDRCPDTAGVAALRGCPDPRHIESEDAINTGGLRTKTEHTGYSGRAFLDGLWNEGGSSSYLVHRATREPGKMTVTVRYASADHDGQTMSLSVDGKLFQQISFPKVPGTWDDWGTVTIPDVPISGTDPIVTISHDVGDTGAINLDWLEFQES